MQDNLFDSPEHIQSSLAILQGGMKSAFWKLMCDILDANIDVVKELLLNGSKEDSIEFINLLRDRLKTYQDVRNTPEDMLFKFKPDSTEKPNLDPYSTIEDLKRARHEVVVRNT